MSNKAPRPSDSNLDKSLVEAGMQCRKRLWLDCNRPGAAELSASRRAMSEAGDRLRELARSVFPKGIAIASDDAVAAAEETRQRLDEGAAVLFGARFVGNGIEAEVDILVRHKDGDVDIYEIKSGTKIAQRYLNDMALQALVLGASGFKLRAAFLLHQNPKYEHKEGAEYPPMQLLRSADVTDKVTRQVPHVAGRIAGFRKVCASETMPELPMGTYCTQPSPCPYAAQCTKTAPRRPAYLLPELTRQQEAALLTDGIRELPEIDPERAGLTFAQRRTIESARQNELIVEDFVKEELRHCALPLHFLSLASLTDALPQFDGQRPWRRTPYGFAVDTLRDDGSVQSESFVYAERGDPRLAVITRLSQLLEVGGTVICWNSEPVDGLRALLDDMPSAKVAVRAVIGRALCDMMQLFDTGVFHPALNGHSDFAATVEALRDDSSGRDLAVTDEDSLRQLLDKARAPRVRATTREKVAEQIQESLVWRSRQMLELFREFSAFEPRRAATKQMIANASSKELPRPSD